MNLIPSYELFEPQRYRYDEKTKDNVIRDVIINSHCFDLVGCIDNKYYLKFNGEYWEPIDKKLLNLSVGFILDTLMKGGYNHTKQSHITNMVKERLINLDPSNSQLKPNIIPLGLNYKYFIYFCLADKGLGIIDRKKLKHDGVYLLSFLDANKAFFTNHKTNAEKIEQLEKIFSFPLPKEIKHNA